MENTTLVNATTEFLNTQISALQELIEKKDALIVSLQDRSSEISRSQYAAIRQIQDIRDSMQEWTLNAISERLISESDAEEIAELCGFDLVKEVDAIVTVEYSVTVKVPVGMDAEDMINDIDFDTVSYNDDHITGLYSSITSIDI